MKALINAPKEAFAVNYYRWALSQWDRELQLDYPTLRAFGGLAEGAVTALDVLGVLSPHERSLTAAALVRRTHTEALAVLGEQLSPDEKDRVAMWLQASRQSRARHSSIGSSRSNRAVLRRQLLDALPSILGSPSDHQQGSAGLRFRKESGRWTVETHFDLGGRTDQLAYSHSLWCDGVGIKTGISPLVWLGVTTTTFDRIGPGEEAAATESVIKLVSLFVDAEEQLLEPR